MSETEHPPLSTSDHSVVPSVGDADATRAIEAILMVADEPVTPQLLGELLEMAPDDVADLCDAMAEDYADEILGTLEVNLSKFIAAVGRGRDRLAGRHDDETQADSGD